MMRMIQTKMNRTISSVLALMFLFAIVEKNIGSATTRNSNAMTSSSAASSSLFASALTPVVGIATLTEDEATVMTPTTTTCVDPTFIFQRTKKKNRRTKTMDLCAWVSSARSKKNNKMKKRCSKMKAGVMVKDQCPCACAEVVTEEDAVSSCPAAGPIFNLLEGNACANIGLTCQYDELDTSCDQVTSHETCECKSNDNDNSSGGVDINNNNFRWECESLHLEPCPDTPAPSVAPTQPRRRPAPPPSTATATAAINSNAHPTSSFFDASTFAGAWMVWMVLVFVVIVVQSRGRYHREGYVNIELN